MSMSSFSSALFVLVATAAVIVFFAVDAAKIAHSSEDAAAAPDVKNVRHRNHGHHHHRADGHHHRGLGGLNWENRGGRGLCGPTSLCCQGKDNGCRAPPSDTKAVSKRNGGIIGHVTNSEIRSGHQTNDSRSGLVDAVDDRECFCDTACLELGDCCDDYKQTCQPVDCVLADEWDEYGECSSRCGPGIKQRRRRIIQPAANGGKPCGKTVEKVHCDGTGCKVVRASGFEELRETGYIIPAVYGAWRKSKRYDPFSDIRRNLFEHYDAKTVIKRPPYCAVFELTDVHPGCNLTMAARSNSPAAPDTNLIDWTSQLVKGATVCVECQPAAMRKKLGARCRGQGVLAKETRWDAVTVPGCRGRWVMKSREDACQCSGSSSDNNNNNNNLKSTEPAVNAFSSLPSFIFV